jgi:DNA invertase Pin-like site-specific DNA recombinase
MSIGTSEVMQGAGVVAPFPPPSGADPRITPRHLSRRALIDVRQSSPTQVVRPPESARRQDGLAERAQRLGGMAEQATIIDEDQGKSGAGSAAAHDRAGLGQRVAAVGLGEVGIIRVLEVSRLARNSAEWDRLLALAALADAVIADEDAIDDPRQFNDRLLRGVRGTISAVELHCIEARLQGARRSKAQRESCRCGCRSASCAPARERSRGILTRTCRGRCGPSTRSSRPCAVPTPSGRSFGRTG